MLEFRTTKKPEDWPINERELRMERILCAITAYDRDPNWRTKALIVGLCSDYDPNQNDAKGVFRTTQYEVVQLNTILFFSLYRNITSLRLYAYEYVAHSARLKKWEAIFRAKSQQREPMPEEYIIEEYSGLFPQLRLYYAVSLEHVLDARESLADNIIKKVKGDLAGNLSRNEILTLGRAYINMLNDLSYIRGTIKDKRNEFTRDEYARLFDLEAEIIDKMGESPVKSPLKGVLMTQISNYVLKSRSGYNDKYIGKYVCKDDAEKIAQSEQIWLRPIPRLNDGREGMPIRELAADFDWTDFDWVRGFSIKDDRDYYVCSFSKNIHSGELKKNYGEFVFGYKGDAISELLSPIARFEVFRKDNADLSLPETALSNMGTQVIVADILYDKGEARKELEYFCGLIDKLRMPAESKRSFLEEIMQYWIYTVKDSENEYGKWDVENERRYVLFFCQGYKYDDTEFTDKYLKIASSIFMYPDFVLGDGDGVMRYIRERITEKMHSINRKDYMFCNRCYSRDFSNIYRENCRCRVCGSTDLELIQSVGR